MDQFNIDGHDFHGDSRSDRIVCARCQKSIAIKHIYAGRIDLVMELEGCRPDGATVATVEPPATYPFDQALNALKSGKRVARAGWNGKGMWVVLIRAGNAMYTVGVEQGVVDMQDCLGLKTSGSVMQPGWLPSQADLLAEDFFGDVG